ncbi:GNAT family N-acetyltransferase [Actibacterium ureilyticum]|uniref:GNAT family N-acetyltransferase n=1 Tax=Actibacterium ureilyticum TaxID=1590614 RepID=UPI000BAAED40|nr:GNAT family N-acetyltransferase [Actibacterium ureilyticum]
MIIRTFVKDDIPEMIDLSRQLAKHVDDPEPNLTAEAIVELAFGNTRWFDALVAEERHGIIGFAAFTQNFEFHTNSRTLFVTDLVVSDQVRRAGVGQSLLEALHRIAIKRNCSAIKFEIWKCNAQAHVFYGKHGAECIQDVALMRIAL